MAIRRWSSKTVEASVLIAVLVIAAPSATAVDAPDVLTGEAQEVVHQGSLHHNATLHLFRIVAEDVYKAPALSLFSESAYGYYVDDDYATVGELSAGQPTYKPEPIGSSDKPLMGLGMDSLGSRPAFDIRVMARDAATVEASIHAVSNLTSYPEAVLDPFDGVRRPDATPTHYDENHIGFTGQNVDFPVVVNKAQTKSVQIEIKGDFVVEVFGLDVSVDSDDGSSRVYQTGVYSSTTGQDELTVESGSFKLLRLFVNAGELTIRNAGSDVFAEWAAGASKIQGDGGRVTFHELDLLGSSVASRTYQFPSGYEGTLTPQQETMAIDLASSQSEAVAPASTWYAPSGFTTWPLTLGLLAIGLVAIALGALRRAPPMDHMESALEAGSFPRAARLARRILRKDPHQESAHLGRAIALSRSGRPRQVVRHLGAYLQRNDPSDGTLHYVLGLAYRDLGDDEAADEALGKAVERTPALAGQIVMDEDVPSAPPRPEVDAQGYT